MSQVEIGSLLDSLRKASKRVRSSVLFQPGLSGSEAARLREKYSGAIPESLLKLLQYSDGMELFGLDLVDSTLVDDYGGYGLFCFHDWGNGDRDCITGPPHELPAGQVVFVNHSPEVVAPVAGSLREWLCGVITEFEDRGSVAHPMEYLQRSIGHGVYSEVPQLLADVDCELNRWRKE